MSSPGRSSGAGGIIVIAVIALVIGAAGGYAGARFFSGTQALIETRDAEIARLQAQIAKVGDAQTDAAGLRDQIVDLEEQVAAQKRTNASLKQYADEQLAKGRAEGKAEIDALNQTLDEAGNAATELAKVRKSLQAAQQQATDLTSQVNDQQRQIGRLRDDLAASANRGDAGVKALQGEIAALESELVKARAKAADAATLAKRYATLEDRLAESEADRAGALDEVKTLKDRQKELSDDLAAARAKLDQLTVGGSDMERLQATLREMKETLGLRDETIANLKVRLDDLAQAVTRAEGDAHAAEAERTKVTLQLRQANADIEKLRTQVATLRQTIADLQPDKTPKEPAESDTKPADDSGTPGPTPRDADRVARALADTPGVGSLSQAKQDTLAKMLTDGECVSTALKSAFGRVPAVALRNLIRDLGSSC